MLLRRVIPNATHHLSARRSSQLRFGIRHLMFATAAVCTMCSLYVAARNIYYSELRQIRQTLAEVENISIISIDGYHDVSGEIANTSISVDSHPNSLIRLGNLDNHEDTGRLFPAQIGKWGFASNMVLMQRRLQRPDSGRFSGSISVGILISPELIDRHLHARRMKSGDVRRPNH